MNIKRYVCEVYAAQSYKKLFQNVVSDESLNLKDNITFVTSEITEGNSLLYMGNSTSAKMFTSNFLQEIEVKDTSCVAVFQLKALNKFCIFIGVKRNSSRILCSNAITTDLRTYQWLESKGSVQVSANTKNPGRKVKKIPHF